MLIVKLFAGLFSVGTGKRREKVVVLRELQ
jgi:hypothetical protein